MAGVEGCENGGPNVGMAACGSGRQAGACAARLEHFGPDQGPSLNRQGVVILWGGSSEERGC